MPVLPSLTMVPAYSGFSEGRGAPSPATRCAGVIYGPQGLKPSFNTRRTQALYPNHEGDAGRQSETQSQPALTSPFCFLSRYFGIFKARNKGSRSSVKYQNPFIFPPRTITTFDIILIFVIYLLFLYVRNQIQKIQTRSLLNQRRHSIPLEKNKETKPKTRGAR